MALDQVVQDLLDQPVVGARHCAAAVMHMQVQALQFGFGRMNGGNAGEQRVDVDVGRFWLDHAGIEFADIEQIVEQFAQVGHAALQFDLQVGTVRRSVFLDQADIER